MPTANWIAARIVRSAICNIDWLTLEKVAQIARELAQPPNGRGKEALRLFCRDFDDAYKNLNYDWRSNGENWLLNQLAEFGPPVVFDVGANVGNWSALARTALPGAELHAFEIIETTFAALRDRFDGSTGITLNNFGLSDRSGSVTMGVFDAANTLATQFPFPHDKVREVTCKVRRGDEYMQDHGIERIGLLKIDVEGAEHLVLSGFGTAIDAGRIDVIQFEYGKVNILTHFLLRDFYEFLEPRGYSVGKLFPDHVDLRPYALRDEDFRGPNYVAVRKTRSDLIDVIRKRST